MKMITCIFTSLAMLLSIAICAPISNISFKDVADFRQKIGQGYHLVFFYSPDCIHCNNFKPVFDEYQSGAINLEQVLPKATHNLAFDSVDCKGNLGVCLEEGLSAVPVVKLYNNGKAVESIPYIYHNRQGIQTFLGIHAESIVSSSKIAGAEGDDKHAALAEVFTALPNPFGEVVELTDNDFKEKLSEGVWFVDFFAPWCPHCRTLEPIWKALGADSKNIMNIAKIDCTKNGRACGAYGIRGFPTLKLFRKGVPQDYWGSRELDSLKQFVINNSKDSLYLSGAYFQLLRKQDVEDISKQNSYFLYCYDADRVSEKEDELFVSLWNQVKGWSKVFLTSDQLIFSILGTQKLPAFIYIYFDAPTEPGRLLNFRIQVFEAALNSQELYNFFLKTVHPEGTMLQQENSTALLSESRDFVFMTILYLNQKKDVVTLNTENVEILRERFHTLFFIYVGMDHYSSYVVRAYGGTLQENSQNARNKFKPRFLMVQARDAVFYEYIPPSEEKSNLEEIEEFIARVIGGNWPSQSIGKPKLEDTLAESITLSKSLSNYWWYSFMFLFLFVIIMIFWRLYKKSRENRYSRIAAYGNFPY